MKVQRSHLRSAVIILVIAVAYNMWAFFKPATRTTPLANRQQPMLSTEAPARVANGPQPVDPLTIQAPPSIDVSAAAAAGRDPFLFGDENRDGRGSAGPGV